MASTTEHTIPNQTKPRIIIIKDCSPIIINTYPKKK